MARPRGGPFRIAHEVAGSCVRVCEERGIELWDLSDEDLAQTHEALTPQVREVLSVSGSLASRSGKGGTAPVQVAEQLMRVRQVAAWQRDWAAKPLKIRD